jgi:HAD superfamily hydrolase (TIGR01549 family)
MAVAAIFDLDGTLVTFNLDIREWRKVLIDVMKKRGFDTDGLDPATPTQQILDFARNQVAPGQPGRFDELRREAFSILDQLELEAMAKASVFPDVVDTLRRLVSGGVRLGVLTNSGRRAAKQSLERWGLLGFFEFVLTRDDTETMKPRPEGLAQAVKLLGVEPDNVCYVGDSPLDILAAKSAGLKVVSVATGNYTAERLRGDGADFVIASLAELPKVLEV